MKYHAHIYWTNPDERHTAMLVRTYLHDKGCALGRIWDKPIGPHPLPMYQAMYDSSNKDCVEDYLESFDLTVLLHEDTGENHVRDHTEGARWLTRELKLDLDFLQRIDDGDI
jgi:aromatic ring-cleaving dioxygenase